MRTFTLTAMFGAAIAGDCQWGMDWNDDYEAFEWCDTWCTPSSPDAYWDEDGCQDADWDYLCNQAWGTPTEWGGCDFAYGEPGDDDYDELYWCWDRVEDCWEDTCWEYCDLDCVPMGGTMGEWGCDFDNVMTMEDWDDMFENWSDDDSDFEDEPEYGPEYVDGWILIDEHETEGDVNWLIHFDEFHDLDSYMEDLFCDENFCYFEDEYCDLATFECYGYWDEEGTWEEYCDDDFCYYYDEYCDVLTWDCYSYDGWFEEDDLDCNDDDYECDDDFCYFCDEFCEADDWWTCYDYEGTSPTDGDAPNNGDGVDGDCDEYYCYHETEYCDIESGECWSYDDWATFEPECFDTSEGATDEWGDGCDEYWGNEEAWCGATGDAFDSDSMCCACDGGEWW